ncbi:MAG: hypothetical protein M1378_07710, partial [Bacteroidetes bacterium]|nr:hypothetical protein [Bacteroidota bacterium]
SGVVKMPATATNNGNHDARLLFIMELAPCRAHHGTPSKDARHERDCCGRYVPFALGLHKA